MPSATRTLAAALFAAALTLPAAAALAQPDDGPPKRERPASRPASPVERVRDAVKSLDLQGQAKTKVDQLLSDAEAEVKAIRDEARGDERQVPQASRREVRVKTRGVMEKLVADVKAELEPRQVEAFEAELQKSRRGPGQRGQGGRGPRDGGGGGGGGDDDNGGL